MIIATWLSQAATEEQTTVLYVILEVYILYGSSCVDKAALICLIDTILI